MNSLHLWVNARRFWGKNAGIRSHFGLKKKDLTDQVLKEVRRMGADLAGAGSCEAYANLLEEIWKEKVKATNGG